MSDAPSRRGEPSTGKGAETRAREAGVSVGNAYYYFASKENLIQAFYARTHDEHLEACREVLVREKGFEARLLGVLYAKLRTIEPYHRFSGILFKTAADPESPLNPFSAASVPTRRESTALFARVIEGTKLDTPSDLSDELPNLLWIYHMGVVLFWIHDRSAGRKRTYALVRHTVPLISRTVRLGNLPLLRSLTRRSTAFLRELREDTKAEEIVHDTHDTDDAPHAAHTRTTGPRLGAEAAGEAPPASTAVARGVSPAEGERCREQADASGDGTAPATPADDGSA